MTAAPVPLDDGEIESGEGWLPWISKHIAAQLNSSREAGGMGSADQIGLDLGDVNLRGAVEEARPILQSLHEVHSARTLKELRPIRDAAEQWPADRDLCEEFDALEQKALTV